MNWHQVETHWQDFKSFARKQWRRLDEDDLSLIRGRREALIQSLEKKYGMSNLEAARCADQWLKMSQDAETVDMRPA